MDLHLVLTHHWFDELAAGRKDVEYRKVTPYWRKRIWEKRHRITSATFAKGYSSITLPRKVIMIDIGPCPYPDWRGKYYRIHLVPLNG